MADTQLATEIAAEHDEGHIPDTDDPNWQESSVLQWYDPIRCAGGLHHVGMQRNRGVADYWNALTLDGRILDEAYSPDEALPDQPFSDLTLGPLSFRSLTPLRKYKVVSTFPDVTADLEYEAYAPNIGYSIDHSGSKAAHGHIESYGRVGGTLHAFGKQIEVKGLGFHDHSWGVRDYADLISHRNFTAAFGPDLNVSFVEMWTASSGRIVTGFIQEKEDTHAIVDARCLLTLAGDGCSPVSTDTDLWTEQGSGYRIKGNVEGGVQINSHYGDYMVANGFAKFEMMGRLGAGIICVRQAGTAAQWEKMRPWRE